MLFGLLLEIGKVQATVLQALHRHDLQTGHHCRLDKMNAGTHVTSEYAYCWVRSMRADWNQTNITMPLPA
jgi:hypothetical protein